MAPRTPRTDRAGGGVRASGGPRRPASVLMIGSEAVPYAKTGGLGDVLGALPLALARLGWDVTLAIPRYRHITEGRPVQRVPLVVGGDVADVTFFEASLADDVRVVLVAAPGRF